jgi:hypothetical protein
MPNKDMIYNTAGIKLWHFILMVLISSLAVVAPAVVSGIWIGVCISVLYGFFKGRMEYVWYGIAASPALEIWSRMASAPLMPYESGKYFLLFCIGLFFVRLLYNGSAAIQYRIGGILLFVLLPGLLVGIAQFDFEQWVFNVLSIIELCLLLIITSRERWHVEQFCRTLQIGLMAIICLTIYISVKSPVFSDIEFSLKASASASGGFGSNQVSSIMGVGIVLTSILLILNRPFFSVKWFNYILLGFFLFRGLLTFSRGGMVVAILALIVAFAPKIFASTKSFIKYTRIFVLFLILGTAVFLKVNDLTGNMLLLRYEGETAGTYQGSKTKTLNTILSGRGDVVMSDLEMFKDHWLFGVAPGQSKLLRRSYGYDMDVAAHTEYTRLMSEQGLGGLIAAIAMFLFPIYWIRRQKIAVWRGVIAALFTIALLTAVHAATRTNITVVFYALACIPVLYEVRKYKRTTVAEDSLHR